jgi:TonB family protein
MAIPSDPLALAFQYEGARRLGNALAISVLAHALLLTWPVSLPAAGVLGTLSSAPSRAAKTLKVTFSRIPETKPEPVPEIKPEAVVEKTPPAPPQEQAPLASVPRQKNEAAPKDEQGHANSIPLVGYYPADKLTKMPEAIGRFDIQPPAGGDTGLGGKMTIRIWIGMNGVIDRVRVLDSGLPQAYADAALAAFEKLHFAPGEIAGVPVKSWVEVVIEYADFRDAAQPSAGAR